jgi:hypothetical protein
MSNCQAVMATSVKEGKTSESAVADFRRLFEYVSLAACKLPIRASEAFRFRGIAENKDLEAQILIWKLHLYLSDKDKNTCGFC